MADSSKGRIALVADDDEFFRMALGKLLTEEFGFGGVVEAKSFDEALEYLNTNGAVSLALFDLAMPGIDSPAVLRSIRSAFDVTRMAVVSGSRRKIDILMALEAGVHGYIPKWLGTQELRRALEIVIGGTIYVPAMLSELDTPVAIVDETVTALRNGGPAPVLTERQRDVLGMVVEGKSTKEIARALDLGVGTIKVHLAGLFRSLGVANRSAAAAVGVKLLDRSPSDFQYMKTDR